MGFFSKRRKKATAKNTEKSELMEFIETNSNIPPTGFVVVLYDGKKKKIVPYYTTPPNDDMLKEFVRLLKLPHVKSYKFLTPDQKLK